MNRKLVLLCNPGCPGDTNYVAHVPEILGRYKNYFQSPVGGFWKDDEILEMPAEYDDKAQITWLALKIKECNSPDVDYSIFVFVGHGGAFINGEAIQLSKGQLAPINCLFPSPDTCSANEIKRTIIIDACRDYHPLIIPTIVTESRTFSGDGQIDGCYCREIYNKAIDNCAPHCELLQSTSYGQYAQTTQRGSAFSDAFFGVLDLMVPVWNDFALGMPGGQLTHSIADILPDITKGMKQYFQVPQYRVDPQSDSFPLYAVWRSVTKIL